MNASGKQISAQHPRKINFGLWWDGDLLRESLDRSLVEKWNPKAERLDTILDARQYNAASINGTKSVPVLSADLFGDWREEVVWRSADNSALLVFSTTEPTRHRITTLMHDPQYRAQVAGQNGGYNQPPHPSFFLGEGMAPAAQEPIYVP
jgi:rhamnogalacturonan endolyase